MSRNLRQHTFIGRFLIAIVVLIGSIAGYLFGRQAIVWESLRKLDGYAKLATVQNDASLSEARNALDTIKHPGTSICADDDIGTLRDLVFHSAHLKDAGRIQGDRIECSAATGRTVRSIASLGIDASRAKGGLTYYILKHTSNAEPNRAVLQFDDKFVIVDAGEPPNQGSDPVRIALTTKETIGPRADAPHVPVTNRAANDQESAARLGETLYATRCSTLGFNCITLSVPSSYVIEHGSLAIAISAAVGAMCGLLLGVLLLNARSRRHDLPSQLRRALDRDKLEVVYQPIVNLATQMIIGAEALARWTNSDGEAVDPDVFVKAAEENGFVGRITRTVLRHILHDFATTLQNRPGFRISMNVAAADLSDPEFLPMMDESLRTANVRPESLVIEITERSAADGEAAMETIRNLRRRGYAIHIDDFGTGHSNLDKLLYLFADTIKIDKAFTQVIGTESVAAAILPQILNMAKSLGLGVVVEGVETRAQSDYFNPGAQKIHAQGWLYGRPSTAEALKSQLANGPQIVSVDSQVKAEATIEVPELATMPGGLHLVKSRIA